MLLPVHYVKDHLYRAALTIALSSIVRSSFGFLFWLIAARLYTADEVGIASATISSVAMVISISRMGLDQSLTRFIPTGNRDKIFLTTVMVTTLSAVLIGIGLVMSIHLLVPDLSVIRENWQIYLLFIASGSIVSIELMTFIAIRRSEFGLLQSVVGGLRIVPLIPLAFLGAVGIVSSELLASVAMAAISGLILFSIGFRNLGVDFSFLKSSIKYSIGNYIAGMTAIIPVQIMPILVMGLLGSVQTAAFYLSFMLFQLLLIIPNSASTSLFVEGSHGSSLSVELRKTLRLSLVLLIPLVSLMILFGGELLTFIGSEYADNGEDMLRVISLSSFPAAVVLAHFSILKVENRVKDLALLSSVLMLLILVTSFALMKMFGVIGVGYSWLLSYGTIALLSYCSSFRFRRDA